MVRIIKILSIILFAAALAVASYIKIDQAILKDFDVVNLNKMYKEHGFPVFTAKVSRMKEVPLIKDIALIKEPKGRNIYSALISRDLLRYLKVGSAIYIPRSSDLNVELYPDETKKNTKQVDISQKAYLGKITSIANEADWQTGFYKVTIRMNEELPERPFQTGKVVYMTLNNSIVALITYLENSNGKYYAWIYDNGVAKRTLLKTGTCDGYVCEILSGLKVGDQIITSDLKKLEVGIKLFDAGSNK